MAKKNTDPEHVRKPLDRRSPTALADALKRSWVQDRELLETVAAALGRSRQDPATAWKLMESAEQQRLALEQRDAPALQIRADYRRMAAELGETWPPISPEQYRAAFLKRIVPQFNAAYELWKLCPDCGTTIAVKKGAGRKTTMYCPNHAKRKWDRATRERPSPAAALAKHISGCLKCRPPGRTPAPCKTALRHIQKLPPALRQRLLQDGEANQEMAEQFEEASELPARGGRHHPV
jgi:hypothetical protein